MLFRSVDHWTTSGALCFRDRGRALLHNIILFIFSYNRTNLLLYHSSMQYCLYVKKIQKGLCAPHMYLYSIWPIFQGVETFDTHCNESCNLQLTFFSSFLILLVERCNCQLAIAWSIRRSISIPPKEACVNNDLADIVVY